MHSPILHTVTDEGGTYDQAKTYRYCDSTAHRRLRTEEAVSK